MKTILMVVFACLIGANTLHAEKYNSFLDANINISIKAKKEVFELGENIEGKIRIQKAFSKGGSNNFVIKMIHNGKDFKKFKTYINHLFFGETLMTFKSFGIPDIGKEATNLGDWTIVIYPLGTDPDKAASVSFKIIEK